MMSSAQQQQEQDDRASRSLGRWGTVAGILIATQVSVALLFLLPGVERLITPSYGEPEVVSILIVALGVVVFYLGAALTFLLWMRRAAWNLRVLHPDAVFTFTPGWAVGWWFVPFANLVKPLQAMHEIWHYSNPENVDAESGDDQQVTWGKKVPALLTVWWVTWVLSNIVERATRDGANAVAVAISSLLWLLAGASCLLVIRRVTAMQRECFASRAQGPRVASSLGHVVGRPE